MSYRSYLEELKKKPDDQKRRIAFLAALGITAVIVLVWLYNFISLAGSEINTAKTANVQATTSSPLSNIGGMISDQMKKVTAGWQTVKGQTMTPASPAPQNQ